MHIAPRWTKLLNGLSARALVVAVLWAMPVTGLVSAFNGLLEGPNFYAYRTVVVDSVHLETRTTRSSGRFGVDDVREIAWVSWHLTDGAGHTRHGMSKGDPKHWPSQGSQVSLLVDVEPSEGAFMLNLKVGQGLAVFMVFGAMAGAVVLMARGREQAVANPRQRRWAWVGMALAAGLMVGVTVVMLVVPFASSHG